MTSGCIRNNIWPQGGGGGNFGIFTSFVIKPIAVQGTVTVVTVQWPAIAYEAAMTWYLSTMPSLDPNFSSDLFLGYGSAQVTPFPTYSYAVTLPSLIRLSGEQEGI